jgi:transposase-like protein
MALTAGLKTRYLAPSTELSADGLDEFANVWDKKYPMSSKSWQSRGNEGIPFFKFFLKSGNRFTPPTSLNRSMTGFTKPSGTVCHF